MYCKKCGALLMENDQFCKKCGAALNNFSAQNDNGGSTMDFNQNNFHENYQQNNNNVMNNEMRNRQMYNQSMNNGRGRRPMYKQPKKRNSSTSVLFGVCVTLIVVLIVALFILLGAYNNLLNNNGGVNNNGSSEMQKSTYTVNYNNFTFKIPSDLVYKTTEDSIVLTDEDGTWASYIHIIEGSYNKLVAVKNDLQIAARKSGLEASSASIKTLSGLEFITLEISDGGKNCINAYAKANSMYIFVVTLYTLSNEYDYELLNDISSVLQNAEFNSSTNSISTFENIDISEISELAK